MINYKGDPSMYWLPQRIRDLYLTKFIDVANEEQFWEFMKFTLGESLFYEDNVIMANTGEVN